MIEVLRSGAHTSVQDLGRFGLRHLGIGQSGALDPLATRQANLLLGNSEDCAVIELTIGPVHLLFHHDCHAVLTGTDFNATLHNAANDSTLTLPPGHVVHIPAGSKLMMRGPSVAGARAYLAVAGGIDVPMVLGSRSTDLNNAFGGYHGRTLQAGDVLAVGTATSALRSTFYGVRSFAPSYVLRALPGADHDTFSAVTHTRFWMQPWRISHHSNRMGLRLSGQQLNLDETPDIRSAGVLPGDVQLPPDGQPIVLSNDAQTIGGYPRIACVIQADLWQLAHLSPLASVYFQPVDQATATQARAAQARYFERLKEALKERH